MMEHVLLEMVKKCKELIQKVTHLMKIIRNEIESFVEENQVTMTYEVEWTASTTRWASR